MLLALNAGEALGFALAGIVAGYLVRSWIARKAAADAAESHRLKLEESQRETETARREARLATTEGAARAREDAESAVSARQRQLSELESRLGDRERLVNQQLDTLLKQETALREAREALSLGERHLLDERAQITQLRSQVRSELEGVARLTTDQARALILKETEQLCLRDANDLSRKIMDQARSRSEEQARRILAVAVQRYAGRHTFENTTATVALQGDDIKGRIIGREGRNIRAFEAATGVTVLIDDTPNAVVLSGFDPVRREIAREAMHRLILDGRIHPTRIEEVVGIVSQEIDDTIIKSGEQATQELGLPPLHPEILKQLGRLKFRHSFSQNILDHSIEVAQLCALMAAEMGCDILTAKRSGLLHDIGKAMNHEIEGSHALIGAEFVQRFGEPDEVVNAVASHHAEVPYTGIWGILVSAADAISASRPGARSETMTTYIRRLEDLEKIGTSFEGVDKCFAVQAGRELRILVQPDTINDEQAQALARNIARKIEDELQYPGQIRVTVVRETRVVEFAK